MTSQRWMLEVKVGAFVILGLVLLVVFVFAIGDFSTTFMPTYRLRVLFDSANGITEGSPVQYAGVEVGKVEGVGLLHPVQREDPGVEVIVRLPKSVAVRSDDQAAISTFGLLGEKYIEITPGPGLGAPLDADARMVGKPPVSTELVIERSNEVLTQLRQTLQGINNLVGDPEARIYLKETVQEARDATRYWKVLGERLNMTASRVEAGHGNLGKFLYNEDLYERVSSFVDDIHTHPWKLLVHPSASRSDKKQAGPTEDNNPPSRSRSRTDP